MGTKTMIKDGITLNVVAGPFPGVLKAPHKQINPCGHPFPTMLCGCKLHDRMCMVCGRSWVQVGDAYYEVEDPHAQKDQVAQDKATAAAVALTKKAPRNALRATARRDSWGALASNRKSKSGVHPG